MQEIFTPRFFADIIIKVILLGIVVFFIQNYFQNKWKPLTAGEVLRKENFLNDKRDAYYEAIELITRYLANTEWTGKDIDKLKEYGRNIGGETPTEIEVNSCFAKLSMYTDNKEIITSFLHFFGGDQTENKKPTTFALGDFVNLIRNDLGYGDIPLDIQNDDYKYIWITKEKIGSPKIKNQE